MAGPRSPGLLHHLDTIGYLVPRARVSCPVPESRSSFRILVPRSGSSFLVPDLTYRFITPSPPSEKEALLTPGIIYTIILFNIGPGNTGPKTRNSLNRNFNSGGSTETPDNHYHAQGTVRGLPGTGVLPVVCAFSFW